MSLCVLAQVCAHILVRVSVPVATKLTSEPQGFPLSPLLLKYWGYRYMLPYPAFLMWVLGVTRVFMLLGQALSRLSPCLVIKMQFVPDYLLQDFSLSLLSGQPHRASF